MPRARNIKPSFFRNPDLAEIDPIGRLLFIGLWTMADREGRLEDRPRYIKFELLPSDRFDIDAGLNMLQDRGFIVRYQHGDAKYIQVINFVKHQNPHIKEAPSTIPAPGEHGASTVQVEARQVQARLNPESPLLNPEPNNGDVPDGTDGVKTFEVIDGGIKPKPKPKYSAEFESFWLAYPSGHGNKARSYEQWRRIKPDEDLRREIMTGLDAWKRCDRWRNGYVKAAEVWLKDSWWEDDPPPAIEAETESLSVRPGATEEELRASMRASIRMMG